ncbi:MAG: serine/threonine protein kinase [Leptolyngbyaceae cyanobacterium SL_7_1]|nr:serine/threonine protein kinase [Leptolyngbyaceae cyanobacterium SL_7_1]
MTEAVDAFRSLSQGRYQIQKQLSKNGGRQTLLAQDCETRSPVVIKLLTFDAEFEWDDLKLFEREAATLKSLSHPQIPQLLDFFEIDTPDEKHLALVQTYILGRSIAEYLEAGRTFTEAEIKQLMMALLEILVYLHHRSPPVVHRDIKPSNIILGERSGNSIGEVFLVDFGSVQTLVNANDHTMTIVGTYGHMPPEQFAGRTVPASDLYGVGVTAITLATQKSPTELPQKDLQIQFESHAQLSPAFANWLKRMTAPIVGDRFASAEEALYALKHLQQWNRAEFIQEKIRSTSKLNKVALLRNSTVAALIYGSIGAIPLLALIGNETLSSYFVAKSSPFYEQTSIFHWTLDWLDFLIPWLFNNYGTIFIIWIAISSLFGFVVSSLAYLSTYSIKRLHSYQRSIISGSIVTAVAMAFILFLYDPPQWQIHHGADSEMISVFSIDITHDCPSCNADDILTTLLVWLIHKSIFLLFTVILIGFAGWLSAQWYKRCVKEN